MLRALIVRDLAIFSIGLFLRGRHFKIVTSFTTSSSSILFFDIPTFVRSLSFSTLLGTSSQTPLPKSANTVTFPNCSKLLIHSIYSLGQGAVSFCLTWRDLRQTVLNFHGSTFAQTVFDHSPNRVRFLAHRDRKGLFLSSGYSLALSSTQRTPRPLFSRGFFFRVSTTAPNSSIREQKRTR